MAKTYSDELEFEHDLVNLLERDKGWKGSRLDHPTEEDLIENWRKIISAHNAEQDCLDGYPLTDSEMSQIIDTLNQFKTPAEMNCFINGGSISIKRDNPDDTLHFGKTVSLKIFDRYAIAGGETEYQIAEQPIFTRRKKVLPGRRGDVLLLIDGIPVIHIELKRSGVDVSQAVHQIEKYTHEGIFATGIFSMVQIFVAMTPEETLYFANPGIDGLDARGNFPTKFMFHWEDVNNVHVDAWNKIAEGLLSMPMAHELIGLYTIADGGDGILKVLRSYQYYAVSTIDSIVSKADWGAIHPMGGYITHTTGSGKTMTSFKAAEVLALRRRADKVIFLVDRIELGTQSLNEYRNFANPQETVNATEDTDTLVSLLTSSEPSAMLTVTSIQKLSRADGEQPYATEAEIAKINAKRVVIIVDECHRTTFGEMMGVIRHTFPHAMLFGFTGTPIVEENAKNFSTTADIFGNELLHYTMADGMADGNVLGFDLIKVMTYDDQDLRRVVALEKAKAKTDAEAINDPKKFKVYYHYMQDVPMADEKDANGNVTHGIESYIGASQYDRDEHRTAVVADILNNWVLRSRNSMFHALLATSSIPEAIKYYRLIKKMAPELKITSVFDPNVPNTGDQAFKEDGLVEIIEDYNARYFGGQDHFTLSNHTSFKKDVAARLAHKKPYKHIENKPDEELDLVIVVEQLLTGFDSKWLNTLYLDKVLEYERVIQAFSRTNRVFGPEKPHGTIVYYRKPHTMEQNIKAAVKLYSGDKPLALFVQKLDRNIKDMNETYKSICKLFEEDGIHNFECVPASDASKAKFARLFKELSVTLESAKVQGFVWDQLTYWFDDEGQQIDRMTFNKRAQDIMCETDVQEVALDFDEDAYLVLAMRYSELFSGGEGGGMDVPYEIDSHLTAIDTGLIDARYMEEKFEKWMKSLDTPGVSPEEVEHNLNELHNEFGRLSEVDQKYAHMLIHDIQVGDAKLHHGWSLRDYINDYKKGAEEGDIARLEEVLGVDDALLRDLIALHPNEQSINSHGRCDRLRETVDFDQARAYFDKINGRPVKRRLIHRYIDELLRNYLIWGGFDVDEYAQKLLEEDQ